MHMAAFPNVHWKEHPDVSVQITASDESRNAEPTALFSQIIFSF